MWCRLLQASNLFMNSQHVICIWLWEEGMKTRIPEKWRGKKMQLDSEDDLIFSHLNSGGFISGFTHRLNHTFVIKVICSALLKKLILLQGLELILHLVACSTF